MKIHVVILIHFYIYVILFLAISLRSELLSYEYRLESEKELQKIKQINEAAYTVFSLFIHKLNQNGYSVVITSTLRTFEEQEYLHEINKKNAKPGESEHNYGTAIDINVHKNVYCIPLIKLMKKDCKEIWEASNVPTIAKEFSLKWGGDFKNYYDPVHFEISLDNEIKK
jgi:hypothetical protein